MMKVINCDKICKYNVTTKNVIQRDVHKNTLEKSIWSCKKHSIPQENRKKKIEK